MTVAIHGDWFVCGHDISRSVSTQPFAPNLRQLITRRPARPAASVGSRAVMEATLPYRLYLEPACLRGRAGAHLRPAVVPRRPGRGRARSRATGAGSTWPASSSSSCGARTAGCGPSPTPAATAAPSCAPPTGRRPGTPAGCCAARTTTGPTGSTDGCGRPPTSPRCRPTSPCTRRAWPSGAASPSSACTRTGRRRWPTSSATSVAATANYPLADLRRGARLTYEVAANWKVIVENYNECYHCGPVHPELCELVPAFRRGGGAGLAWDDGIPHRDGAWTFTSSGTSARAPFPGLSAEERVRHKGALVYPNLLLSLSADHVAAFTLLPRAPGHTTVVLRLPVRAGGDRRSRLRPDGRGRLLGPRQPPGLAHRRERAAGHGLLRGRSGLVRADGGRLGRHRSLVPPRHGRRHRGRRGPIRRP